MVILYCDVCGVELDSENKYNDYICYDCKCGGYEEYKEREEQLKKDWTGNKKSTFVTSGASNHSEQEREINDFYSTDPNSLEIFLNKIEKDGIKLNHYIWEPACGNGALSEVLIEHGYDVFSSDLVDRGYGVPNFDFLKTENLPFEKYDKEKKWDILTNPPYKICSQFVEHAINLIKNDGDKVIMFLKIQFLEGKERRKLFEKFPPKYIYVNSARQFCYLNGDTSRKMSSAICYCWYIWEKGWKGESVVRWI